MPNWTQADLVAHLAKRPKQRGEKGEVSAESRLHTEILTYCTARGWIAFHGSMAHRARRTIGEPDFTILADGGRVVCVECKRKGGKLSREQAALHAWAAKLGHTIHTVRSLPEFLHLFVNPNPHTQ